MIQSTSSICLMLICILTLNAAEESANSRDSDYRVVESPADVQFIGIYKNHPKSEPWTMPDYQDWISIEKVKDETFTIKLYDNPFPNQIRIKVLTKGKIIGTDLVFSDSDGKQHAFHLQRAKTDAAKPEQLRILLSAHADWKKQMASNQGKSADDKQVMRAIEKTNIKHNELDYIGLYLNPFMLNATGRYAHRTAIIISKNNENTFSMQVRETSKKREGFKVLSDKTYTGGQLIGRNLVFPDVNGKKQVYHLRYANDRPSSLHPEPYEDWQERVEKAKAQPFYGSIGTKAYHKYN